MRTAEETYNSIIKNNRKGMPPMEVAIKCIRVTREDIVLECAKRVTSKKDKQSILNLINELA